MLKGFAAGLVALALAATPAAAANVSGFYAGIYGANATPTDMNFGLDDIVGGFVTPGVIETPSSFVNDGGVDPVIFDYLNTALEDYPFAFAGGAQIYSFDGVLDLLDSASLGVVIGYGLGNGVRIEGDFTSFGFDSGLFTEATAFDRLVLGGIDGAGVWTWTNAPELPFPIVPPYPLSDDFLDYQLDVQFLLLSAFYDIDTGTSITPYLGGGAGVARVTGTLTDHCICAPADNAFEATVFAPAAQIGGGVRVAVGGPTTLDVGYRYKVTTTNGVGSYEVVDLGLGSFGGFAATQSGIIGVHTLQAGLTFALP